MKPRTRHAVFILVALAVGGVTGGLMYRARMAAADEALNSKTHVRILALAGVFQKPLLKKLEDERHLHIVLTEAADPEALWDIFDAPANTHFDLVTLMSYQVPAATQMVRIVPLSLVRVDLNRISSDFRGIPGDTNHNRVVPILWGLSGLLYNSEKIETAPDSWTDVFSNKALKGHIGLLRAPIHLLNWMTKSTLSRGDEDSDVGPSDQDLRKSLKPILTASQFGQTSLSTRDLLESPQASEKLDVLEMNLADADTLPAALQSKWKFTLPHDPSPIWIISLAMTADSKTEKENYLLLSALTEPDFARVLSESSHQATTLIALDNSSLSKKSKSSYLREIPLTTMQLEHDFQGALAVHAAMEDDPGITESTSE